MTEWMDKEIVIHRDAAGNLLPVEETVEFLNGKRVKLIPLSRGEFRRLQNNTEPDKEVKLIKEHYVLPQFSDEDFELMTWKDINALLWCLMSASTGFAQQYFHDKTMAAAADAAEDVLKKGLS